MAEIDVKFMNGNRKLAKNMGVTIKPNKKSTKKSATKKK